MAIVKPFKGLRYNPAKVKLEDVITEPYDRITPAMQEDYYNRNPYNVVRIILQKEQEPGNPEPDKYKRAKNYMEQFQKEGAMLREKEDTFYIYEQEFLCEGKPVKRTGLISMLKLEEFNSGWVSPHERIFPKHMTDRMNLKRVTEADTESVFLMYVDDKKDFFNFLIDAEKKGELVADIKDEDGFTHKMWAIRDKDTIEKIKDGLAEKKLIVADGHHRYTAALNYSKEMAEKFGRGNNPYEYVLATIYHLDDPGLIILPTFRMVRNLDKFSVDAVKDILSKYFNITEMDAPDMEDKAVQKAAQDKVNKTPHTFVAFIHGYKKALVLTLKSEDILDSEIKEEHSKEWKRLDVAVLHSLIIDKLAALTSKEFSLENNVDYIRNLAQGVKKVKDGEFQMIFLLPTCSLRQIQDVVENGEVMPQKSTDFFPKLKSGLVMSPLSQA